MKHNVGGWDRKIRWIVGAGSIVAGLLAIKRSGWRAGVLAFGTSELLTAATRYCPLNQALGVDTRRTSRRIKDTLRESVPAMVGS